MKYVIFDIDGTLTHTKKVDDKCFMKAFEQTFGIDIWQQEWSVLKHVTDWGITEEIIQREWGRVPTKEEYESMISHFVANLKAESVKDGLQFNEIPGASSFFNSLKKMEEFKLGIATGSWEQSARLKLGIIGVGLEGICFSNSDDHRSREDITKDVIAQLSRKYQFPPKQIVYFGDGAWDYKTCKNLGIKFIGIDVENDGKLRELGAETIFKDFTNSEQILKELK